MAFSRYASPSFESRVKRPFSSSTAESSDCASSSPVRARPSAIVIVAGCRPSMPCDGAAGGAAPRAGRRRRSGRRVHPRRHVRPQRQHRQRRPPRRPVKPPVAIAGFVPASARMRGQDLAQLRFLHGHRRHVCVALANGSRHFGVGVVSNVGEDGRPASAGHRRAMTARAAVLIRGGIGRGRRLSRSARRKKDNAENPASALDALRSVIELGISARGALRRAHRDAATLG